MQDLSQQTLSASSNVLVHPAHWYVGGRTPSNVGKAGVPFEMDLVVTDLDGSPVEGQDIQVTAQQVYRRNAEGEASADSSGCQLRSDSEPVSCSLVFPEGGLWRIEMSIEDATGRESSTRLVRWIAGGDRNISSRGVDDTTVTLIPDEDSYKPGDVAKIQIQSPIVRLTAASFSTDQAFRHEPIQHSIGFSGVADPIEDAHVPNLHVSVFLREPWSLVFRSLVVTNQAEGHINLSTRRPR